MVSAVRQRWRVTFRRRPSAREAAHGPFASAWVEALAGTGLPFPDGRPRLAFAMPLLPGVGAEHDLVDLELGERLPMAAVRAAIVRSLPQGVELVELHDVWPGEPPLPAQARRADYLVEINTMASSASLQAAAVQLLAAECLPRRRDKGGRSVEYDLRPLIVDLAVENEEGAAASGLARLRVVVALDPERGVGRPEEVVAAFREATGGAAELTIERLTRRRILLDADLAAAISSAAGTPEPD